jgi:hypothetical protein
VTQNVLVNGVNALLNLAVLRGKAHIWPTGINGITPFRNKTKKEKVSFAESNVFLWISLKSLWVNTHKLFNWMSFRRENV